MHVSCHRDRISLSGLPSFVVSDNVTQVLDSNTASEVAGSTVISWSPASVSGGGVSYTVSLDGVVVASTTDTTATLTGLDFNRTYSVSVEAVNVDCVYIRHILHCYNSRSAHLTVGHNL